MTEILLGQAKHERIGNDLFWSFIKHDGGMCLEVDQCRD